MSEVKVLKDALDICIAEIIDDFSFMPMDIVLYGSFTYQNLDTPTGKFKELNGKKGAFDRKPDFLAVVPDLEAAVQSIGCRRSWNRKGMKKVAGLRQDTPFFFNLSTLDSHDVELKEKTEKARLKYKIGVIREDMLLKPDRVPWHNLYLAARLSKPVDIVHARENGGSAVLERIDRIRDYFIGLALGLLPRHFTGEKFIKRYLHTTYIAEAHRVFDIIRRKHSKILKSSVYGIESGTMSPMKAKLEEMIAPMVAERDDVALESAGRDFYESTFTNRTTKKGLQTAYEFAFFNLTALGIVMTNNWTTNSVAGGSSLGYVARKFARLFQPSY